MALSAVRQAESPEFWVGAARMAAFPLSAVPEAPDTQRIGGSAGSHGAVGRPASVRGH